MAENTIIAWTHSTWNLAWGCTKISPGCANCYADTLSHRYGFDVWGPDKSRRTFGAKHWGEPLAWNRKAEKEGYRHRVFCSSMTDVFLDDPIITREREKLWPLIRATPHLDWLLLTKRSNRIAKCLPSDWGTGYDNVWLGVSVESQPYVSRIDDLLAVPAVIHFVSAEPLIGPLDLAAQLRAGLDWVIVGGESGSGYRPMDHAWARSLKSQCEETGRAFFFKQSAAPRTEVGIELDGEIVRNYPTPQTRRVPLSLFGD